MARRVFNVAKDLGIAPKAIVEKCRSEGIPESVIKNHMSTVSSGLEASIREWFGSGSAETETADYVDLEKVKARSRRSRPDADPLLERLTTLKQRALITCLVRNARRSAILLNVQNATEPILTILDSALSSNRRPLSHSQIKEAGSQISALGKDPQGVLVRLLQEIRLIEIGKRQEAIDLFASFPPWRWAKTQEWNDALTRSMARDCQLLSHLTFEEGWSSSIDSDAAVLGPLWVLGEPIDLDRTNGGDEAPVMQIELVVPVGMSAAQSAEFNDRVASFYESLSRLHAAMGGEGLQILDEASCETILASDEIPVNDRSPAGVGSGV